MNRQNYAPCQYAIPSLNISPEDLVLICADCRQHGFHFHRLPFPGLEPSVGGAAPARRLSPQSEGLQERPPAVQEWPGGLSGDAQHEGIGSL